MLSNNVLIAGTNDGSAVVIVRNSADACSHSEYEFKLKADSCSACSASCPAQGAGLLANNSVNVKIALGGSAFGSAEYLQIKQQAPTVALGSPASLRYAFASPDVEAITNAIGLVQIRGPRRPRHRFHQFQSSYTLRFYLPAQVGDKVGAVYAYGGDPVKSITVENVGGDTNHFRVTDSNKGVLGDYVWAGPAGISSQGKGSAQRPGKRPSSATSE